MFRWISHVVSHDIDEIKVLHAGTEVDELGIGNRSDSQQRLLAKHLAEVAHEQREVIDVIRRCRDSCLIAGRILPVDVDSVKAIFIDGFLTVSRKPHTETLVGSHLAEVSSCPSADGEDDFQLWILLLQLHYLPQEISILDGHAIERVGDLAESIVQVGHQRRIGHALRAP